MKHSITSIILLAAANLGAAQLGGLPTCAVKCAVENINSTGCTITDKKCLCMSDLVTKVVPCAQKECTAQDYDTLAQAAQNLCNSFDAKLNIPPYGSARSASMTDSTVSAGATATSQSTTQDGETKTSPARRMATKTRTLGETNGAGMTGVNVRAAAGIFIAAAGGVGYLL